MRFKSKSYIDTLLLVHFEVIQTYFVPLFLCTAFRRLVTGCRWGAGARREDGGGSQAGGDTPPLDDICWDDKGVWNAEIFFEFRGTGFG